jgi:hypothetical protein
MTFEVLLLCKTQQKQKYLSLLPALSLMCQVKLSQVLSSTSSNIIIIIIVIIIIITVIITIVIIIVINIIIIIFENRTLVIKRN